MFRFSVALTLSPLTPLPLEGKGGVVLRGGEAPSFLFLPLLPRIHLPIMERGTKGVIKILVKQGVVVCQIKKLPALVRERVTTNYLFKSIINLAMFTNRLIIATVIDYLSGICLLGDCLLANFVGFYKADRLRKRPGILILSPAYFSFLHCRTLNAYITIN